MARSSGIDDDRRVPESYGGLHREDGAFKVDGNGGAIARSGRFRDSLAEVGP